MNAATNWTSGCWRMIVRTTLTELGSVTASSWATNWRSLVKNRSYPETTSVEPAIVQPLQPQRTDRIDNVSELSERLDETLREVLIEQDLHGTVSSFECA